MHPVQLVFEHLTKIVEPFMGDAQPSERDCSFCERSASEYGGKAYPIVDAYGMKQNLCPACYSFNVGAIDVLGVERISRGTPISNKFGMLPGVGWVFCPATKQHHLLAPAGVTKKLPAATIKALNVVEMTEAGHLPFLLSLDWPYPLLYIRSFGIKTRNLIRGLRLSQSSDALVCCSDDGIDSTNRVLHTIDIKLALALSERLASLSKADVTLFGQIISALAHGRISPSEATSSLKGNQAVIDTIKLCPVDPHQRISLLRLVRKIQE
ncbi:hypothetical protein ACTG16_22420 [Aeromonas sp. 23P]|uniref:hypothetical protein n=1 Tax=Aeromonas sp. 23P TaxID=3452716 RepID=UPI003F7A20B2|nr:hypothetical protein [Aeromonas veronii]